MALTFGTKQNFDLSKPSPQMNVMGHKEVLMPITFDTSYPSGGEALTAANCGLSEIYDVVIAKPEAETAVIQGKSSLAAAKATKNEYLNGTYVEQEKSIENDIFNAQQELIEAGAYLEHSLKLQAKGFITAQTLRSDSIAVERAKNNVELAEQRLKPTDGAVKLRVALTLPTGFKINPLAPMRYRLAAADVSMALYPLSAFRAMNAAALNVYQTIRQEGTQQSVVKQMQTRDELYDFLNYHSFEQKLDHALDHHFPIKDKE